MSRTLASQLLGRALTAGLFRTTATNSLTSGRLFLDWSSPLPLLVGICIACLLIQAAPATAENLPSADFYSAKVKPLLTEKCISCHGPTRAEGGLRLDAAELIHRGATSGPVLNLEAPGTSLLLTRIASTDPAERMPPTSEGVALKSEEQAILHQWLSSGAPKPADETYLSSPADHWAYRPIVRPWLSDSTAPPIDAFIDRQLQQAGLAPLPTATPTTLLRRLHVDLLGLPPTSEDLQHADELTDPRRFARYVDRLLTRPEYGERWGRHWMDVWRYSDWDGYKDELRGSQRHVWRWRDWIIESLNESKPYATMITEMLAADELHPDDANSLRATGFLARDFHTSNRNIWLDATVEHTAKAFLGLTINCAKCHDHKYDPIAQVDYYEFRAIFEPHHVRTDPVPGTTDPKQNGVSRVYDSQLDAPTYLFVRGDDKHPNKEQPLAPAVPSLFSISFEPQPIPLPLASTKPWLQPFAREDLIAAAQTKVNTARTQLDKVASDQTKGDQDRQLAHHKLLVAETDLQSLKLRYAIELARLESNNNGSTNSAAIELLLDAAREQERLWVKYSAEVVVLEKQAALKTAEASEAKDEAKRNANIEKAKKELADAETKLAAAQKAIIDRQGDLRPIGPTYPDHSTGRRTALARWITDPQNPLTARVAVNHLWMRIMGKPLVDNVFDFGLKTATPKQIELLDYLARELIDHQWDLKYLLRQIVSSAAYQRASSASPSEESSQLAADPENRLLWRAEVRRADAEVVRDSLLFAAGMLQQTFRGADLDHEQGESVYRRSLYFRHAYEKQMTMLVLFDAASPNECYRRNPSIIPQQALVMANSELSRKMAASLTDRLVSSSTSDTDYIDRLFIATLARPPTPEERDACLTFLADQTRRLAPDNLPNLQPVVPPTNEKKTTGKQERSVAADAAVDPLIRARRSLAHVLLNHNDFITIR